MNPNAKPRAEESWQLLGRNVIASVDGETGIHGTLTLVIDLDAPPVPSPSGKSNTIGTTAGRKVLTSADGAKVVVGLSVYDR